jgi:hypothetical protein
MKISKDSSIMLFNNSPKEPSEPSALLTNNSNQYLKIGVKLRLDWLCWLLLVLKILSEMELRKP